MTKRTNNFETNIYKKQKLDNDIDALWGDDLDDSIFDDCLIRASQVLEENVESNASILPSYNVFKEPGRISASTQLETIDQQSTSINSIVSNSHGAILEYEDEIKKLQQQCKDKDGEVTILRTQLREMKNQSNIEQHRFHNEWKTKFDKTEKQFQSIKSEMEFKNLEIANLKQKIMDVTKLSINTSVDISGRNTISRKITEARHKSTDCSTKLLRSEELKLHVILEPGYPLKNLAESVITTMMVEKYAIENILAHSTQNSIPYLKNQTISTKIIIEKNRVNIDALSPTILLLSKSSTEELNHLANSVSIKKLINASLILIIDLQEFLGQIKNNLSTEGILEADSLYLRQGYLQSSNERHEDQIGFKSAKVLNFLAESLPYIEYLKKYIFNDKNISFEGDPFSEISPKETHGGHTFLKKIIGVVRIIGEIRKAELMSNFLKASIKFFTNICRLKKYECVSLILCDFTKELILLRPPIDIICDITVLFKEASQYPPFIEFLLNKSKSSSSKKKGTVYFTKDACRLYIYVLMFERYMNTSESVPFDVCLNLLCFIYNTYKTAFFVHHQNIRECDCLSSLYKLEMEIVFRALKKFIEETNMKKRTSQWSVLFENKMSLKVLSLMTFHSYELTEKYITVYSQYKEIERQLQELDLWNSDQINIHEDIPEIDSRSFENIGFE